MKLKKVISTILTLAIIFTLIPAIPSTSIQASATINIGDYIQMGKYYDEPILWRCVDIDANGPLMLADKILMYKPFDAAGDHKYLDGTAQADSSGYRTKNGSNLWETSNMRSWLNSTATAGNVTWLDGCPPTEDMVWNGYNDYATEKGFLAEGNFTASEQNAIKSVTQKSLLNSLDVAKLKVGGTELYIYNPDVPVVVQNYFTAYYQNVTDKIFLLDIKQLNHVYENSNILGTSYQIGTATLKAVNNSEYKSDIIMDWYSWNRSPSPNSGSPDYVRRVGDRRGNVDSGSARYGNIGVRPAFYINLPSVLFNAGNGSVRTPYLVTVVTSTPGPTTPTAIPTATLEPTATPTPKILLGDAIGDGKVTSADALLVLHSVSGKVILTDVQKLNADVTKNGYVQSSDALMVLLFCSGKITGF